MFSLANFNNNCFLPELVKLIVALPSSNCSISPIPNFSCETFIPILRLSVSALWAMELEVKSTFLRFFGGEKVAGFGGCVAVFCE